MGLKGTDAHAKKRFFGFCKTIHFGRRCDSINCINNIIASKIFKILYAFIVRSRSDGLDIYLDDIVPIQEVDTLVESHLQPVGFEGGLVLDARYPTSESPPDPLTLHIL